MPRRCSSPGIENGDWKGLVYGAKAEEANTGIYQSKQCAEMGFIIKDGAPYKSRPYDMFLSEEVDFLKAELFARNLVAGDAKAAYEAGYVLPSRLGVYRVMLRSIWLPRKRMRLVPARNMTINKAQAIRL